MSRKKMDEKFFYDPKPIKSRITVNNLRPEDRVAAFFTDESGNIVEEIYNKPVYGNKAIIEHDREGEVIIRIRNSSGNGDSFQMLGAICKDNLEIYRR